MATVVFVEESRASRDNSSMSCCRVMLAITLVLGASLRCRASDDGESNDAPEAAVTGGMIDAQITVSPKADHRGLPRIGVSPRRITLVTGALCTRAGLDELDGQEFVRMSVTVMKASSPSSNDQQIFRIRARRLADSNHLELRVQSTIRWRLVEEDGQRIDVRRRDDGNAPAKKLEVPAKKLEFEAGEYVLEVQEAVNGAH